MRKPLEKGMTIADNVLKWGTGGLNIDGSRVEPQSEQDLKDIRSERPSKTSNANDYSLNHGGLEGLDRSNRQDVTGRFPANLIMDSEAGKMLDEQSGESKSGGTTTEGAINNWGDKRKPQNYIPPSKGGASRFFYCPKASKSERNKGCEGLPKKDGFKKNTSKSGWCIDTRHPDGGYELKYSPSSNHHPTVKPIKLMSYLINLVTKEGQTVLDPFAGSGSTLVACKQNNRKFIGIEKEEEYIKIIEARLSEEDNKLI